MIFRSVRPVPRAKASGRDWSHPARQVKAPQTPKAQVRESPTRTGSFPGDAMPLGMRLPHASMGWHE